MPRIIEPTPLGGAPVAAPPPPSPGAVHGGSSHERFGPVTIDLRPLRMPNGDTLSVTRIPAFTTVDGALVFPPFSPIEALDYGAAHGLALPSAAVMDQVRAQGWWHPPYTADVNAEQTGFYPVAKPGDMSSDFVIKELGRRWTRAFAAGDYDGNMFVPNVTKAWIADAVALQKPGYGVNRGYWMSKGDKEPIQKRGQAHNSRYSDLAQGGWFVRDTPTYRAALQSGAYGDAPFDYAAFEAATRGGLSGIVEDVAEAAEKAWHRLWGYFSPKLYSPPSLLIRAWKGSERWSDADIRRLVSMADAANINPADLLLVHLSETGGGDPARWVNRQGDRVVAAGFLQWTRSTAKALGYDLEDIAAMGITSQLDVLEKHIAKYLKGRKIRDAADLYLLNFGQQKAVKGEPAYDVNVPLDRDKDGDIERDDMVSKLSQVRRNQWDNMPWRDV